MLILYCGVALPLEVAFDIDIKEETCGVTATRLLLPPCTSYLVFFWWNVVVDFAFCADVLVNIRTG